MHTKKNNYYFLLNREIRRVPLDWEHPRDATGAFLPLQDRNLAYTDAEIAELIALGHSRVEIECWLMPDFSSAPDEQLGLCVYETTTEGTPMTPVFVDTPEGRWALVQYCANSLSVFANRMLNVEAWAELLFGDSLAALDLRQGRVEFRFGAKSAPKGKAA